ncbi:ankyrin repeat-containing domain protein, partial [Lasiosphaeria miniovina]
MRLCENQTPVGYDARVEALQQTCEAGHVKIVEFLLTETSPAVSGSYRAIDTEAKNKALGIAVENGQLDVAKLFLKHGAALEGVVFIGSSPLHIAVNRRDRDMCRFLLETNNSYLNSRDSNGRTALFTAAWNADDDMVDLLLLKAKAEPDAKNKDDETPLHLAVSRGFVSVAMTLLEAGASPVTSKSDKDTPLHAACRTPAWSDLTPFVAAALDAGRTTPDLADTDMDGRTLLSLAVISGQVEVVKLLLQR